MNVSIAKVTVPELPECLEVIHQSFRTVAEEFGLTQENCPKHTSFIPLYYLAHMKGDLKMNIHAVVEDRVCSLSVAGRIDTLTAPELEQAFADHSAECDKMIFDLSEVDYISSAGLRVIVAAHREMEKKNGLILRGLSKNVESIIKLTGFNRIMHIEP